MPNKMNEQINIILLCEKLFNEYPFDEWHTTVLSIVKKVNSFNLERLRTRDLNKTFRQLSKKSQNELKKSSSNSDGLIHISTLLKSSKEPRWVIKDLLPEHGITILSGRPGSFKTWTTLHFAICIANGRPAFNHFETLRGNVLIIDEEDGEALLRKRLKLLSADKKDNIQLMIMSGFKIDHNHQVEQLFQNIKKYKIKVLIIDSLVRIHLGDENSSKDIAKMFEILRRVTTKGVTVLINHHHRKQAADQKFDNSPMRGSSDILAAIDCHMKISHEGNHLNIKQDKNRLAQELQTFTVDILSTDNQMELNYLGNLEDEFTFKAEEAKNKILKILTDKNDWIDRSEIDGQLTGQVGKNNIGVALIELTNTNTIECNIASKNKKKYKLNSG